MFKKTRAKIVAAIMAISVLLLAGMLIIIYAASYRDVFRKNQEMLERYASLYLENGNPAEAERTGSEELSGPEEPSGEEPSGPEEPSRPEREEASEEELPPDISDGHSRVFNLSTFYSVCFDENGEVSSIDNNDGTVYSREEIIELAELIMEKEQDKGYYSNLSYIVEREEDYVLVVFMDNTVEDENFTTIRKYTLFFGSITLVIIFILSWFLSGRILMPLEENSRRQKQFISDAGHELKTPISVISTNGELLFREIGPNKWLENIQHENSRMAALVTHLMELAKAENVSPEMTEVDFGRIIMGELLSFESVAFEKGIMLEYDEVEAVKAEGNEKQLGQLAAILLDNALEHSTGGCVEVSLKTVRNRAVFSVANEGPPIPEEQREHLFERFYRGDFARSGESSHYGLGLAIAKAVVTSHGGELGVSCGEGRITFTASIPLEHPKRKRKK